MKTQQLGRAAEDKALEFLNKQGLKLVVRNYSCRAGELDLIMRDKAYLVFVEVRARSSMRFGGALASVTYSKKQKIMRAASHYLTRYQLHEKMPLRFDVIAFEGTSGALTWLKDAFGADY